MDNLLRITDRWLRICGALALVALAVTALSLAMHWGAWRLPFTAAHLAALCALVPLGCALIVRECTAAHDIAGSIVGTPAVIVRRHPQVIALLAVVVVSVAVSLANFAGGTRWLRTVANLVTVSIVLTLVARYLRDERASTS